MVERKPIRVLFVGDRGIGMLINEYLHDDHPDDLVEIETEPENAELRLSRKDEYFDLLLTGRRLKGDSNAGRNITSLAKQSYPWIKVILLSADVSREEALEKIGADEHWVKSSDVSGLIKIINDLFTKKPL